MNKNFYTLFLFTTLWILGVGFGVVSLMQYDNTPGQGENPAPFWPENSKIEKKFEHQLLFFAHPHCACTNASLEELKVILKNAPELSTQIVFMIPEEAGNEWLNTRCWQNARSVPNASLFADAGAKEAKVFGVETSGHALLYGPKGDLLFSGGITIARGHAGNNPGRESILAHISGAKSEYKQASTPVFGCSLTGK